MRINHIAMIVMAIFGAAMVAACGSTDKRGATVSAAASGAVARFGSVAQRSADAIRPDANDSDNDPTTDNDPDNAHPGMPDDDRDYSEDHEKPGNGLYHDRDDSPNVSAGHSADAADRRAVTALVERYLAVGASGDGATACAMMQRSIARAVVEDYASGAGPPYVSGARSCRAAMVRFFDHFHDELALSATVTDVRVVGHEAIALLGSPRVPARYIWISREGHSWKVGAVLPARLP